LGMYIVFLILSLSSLTVPDELLGTRISRFLTPRDVPVFQAATQTSGRTILTLEVQFYLRIEPYDEREDTNSALYQLMHYPYIPAIPCYGYAVCCGVPKTKTIYCKWTLFYTTIYRAADWF
jgi:hypothetical protein